MMKDKYDKMLTQFEQYYSCLYEETIDWWPSGKTSITVKLEDGILMEYDSLDNMVRRIQPDDYTKDIDNIRKDIGYNLKKLIYSRGIPQSEIAEKSGVTQAMLSRYIHGTSLPGIDKVYTLAQVLGCRPIDILGECYSD
jgi:predicted XRE-type DNA-binding protein